MVGGQPGSPYDLHTCKSGRQRSSLTQPHYLTGRYGCSPAVWTVWRRLSLRAGTGYLKQPCFRFCPFTACHPGTWQEWPDVDKAQPKDPSQVSNYEMNPTPLLTIFLSPSSLLSYKAALSPFLR